MQKITEVEEARALMNVAKDWSVWHWLLEKKRVRIIADKAVDAFGEVEKKVKATWDEDMKKAYHELEAQAAFNSNPRAKQRYEKAKDEAKNVDAKIRIAVQRVKEADDEAYKARMDAEDTFAEAERRLSASMSRQGAEKALESYDLREKAIRRAEALARRKS
jgi:hypothetical protein